ncbi:MAG: hypothetical protein MPN21_00370 [Thermoanaerobaculia bacterium]|nr:hypothetical protein [Thermoanaerobaculia bacterium]
MDHSQYDPRQDPFADPLDETHPPALPLDAHKQALVDRIGMLIGDIGNITFIVPDESGYFSIEDDLVKQVRDLLERTLELMCDLTDHYDHELPEPEMLADIGTAGAEDEVLKEIGAAISSELASQELANMAFIARTQLRENHEALVSAMDSGFIWVVASNADTGLRRAGKALLTLETAVREYEDLPPRERRWNDLGDSLEIRRVYGQFRRWVLRGDPEPKGEDLHKRLQSAAHRIAILRDLKIYPFLRIYDRVPIRKLQKRILRWLDEDSGRDGADGSHEEVGRRLWSDLVSFAELLAQINHREELREHDRRTIKRVHRLLFDAKRRPDTILPAHLQDLETLIGRDDELDRIILDPRSHAVTDLQEPLRRILEELDQPFSPRHDALDGFQIAEQKPTDD